MYKAYLFDCGNVLIGFSREHLLDVYVGTDENDRKIVSDATFEDWAVQDEWMPSLEYYEMVKKKLPERLHKAAYNIIMHWKEETWPIKGMEELIVKLKKAGKKLNLISNMPDNVTYNHDDISVLRHFDDLVFSFELKMIKPNPEIFEHVLNKHSLTPSECLFIDDNEDNIETAKRLGINAYHFDQEKADDFIALVEKIEF
ncbi:MAG: HAD family phosphatase [Bacilli bacterium]|nr:HAD family phosphatase [Bacilli bacterium]